MRTVPALFLLSGVPSAVNGLWFYRGLDDEWLSVTTAVFVLAAVAAIVCFGPAAAWANLAKRRTPSYEQLPRATTSAIFVLLLATAVSTSLLTVGVAVASLTFGDESPYPSTLRPYMLLLCAMAVAIGLLAPWVALQSVRLESDGSSVAIFDPTVPEELILASVDRRWRLLINRKRYLYPDCRMRFLGSVSEPPATAWPSSWGGAGRWRPRVLFSVLACSVALAGLGVAVGVLAASRLGDVVGVTAFVLLPGLLMMLAAVTAAYALLLEEQNAAALLRRARGAARERMALRPKPLEREPQSVGNGDCPDHKPLAEMTRGALLREAFRRGRSCR